MERCRLRRVPVYRHPSSLSVEQAQIGFRSDFGGRLESRCTDAEQADLAIELHALQAFARGAPDDASVLRRFLQRAVARDGLEVVVAQLQADGATRISLAPQIVGHAGAEFRKDAGQRVAV